MAGFDRGYRRGLLNPRLLSGNPPGTLAGWKKVACIHDSLNGTSGQSGQTKLNA
jgi:hypothetical protein